VHHKLLSLATDWSSTSVLGVAPSKTQAFRCFHNSQATKMIRLLRPLRYPLGTPLMVPHHQPEKRILDPWGAKDRRSSFWKIMVQICRANTHEMRVCWIFSSAWSQSGHAGGWGSPRLARRSAVQHQLLMDNQTKNLHHKGAQLLQICFQGANLMLPRKKALYADLLLYVPVILSFYLC